MGEQDLIRLAEESATRAANKVAQNHRCMLSDDDRTDLDELLKAKREARASHGDLVNSFLLGKSLNGWHIKGLNLGGLLLLGALVWIVIKSSGLWGIIIKGLTIK